MQGDLIGPVRKFNRTVTQRIGALGDEYLARSRPLGASRVLWEIGDGGADVRAIRARLDLDSGYLSRLLRGLQDERLVRVQPARDDHRVRAIRLTEAGRAERAELDRHRSAGYVEVPALNDEPYAHHWFEKRLTDS
jgi:DNA-binding MarR family transcriptional regulator